MKNKNLHLKNVIPICKKALLVSLFLSLLVHAEKYYFIITLDTSGSMRPYFAVVQQYVTEQIIGKAAKPGDEVIVIRFDNYAEVSARFIISETNDLSGISRLRAVGQKTDLSAAVVAADDSLRTVSDQDANVILFLLTDGVNDPPRRSPFYSPDGQFHQDFITHSSNQQRKGWQIIVTGIGQNTCAQKLNQILGGKYIELSANPSLDEMIGKITSTLYLARRKNFTISLIIFAVGLLLLLSGLYLFVFRKKRDATTGFQSAAPSVPSAALSVSSPGVPGSTPQLDENTGIAKARKAAKPSRTVKVSKAVKPVTTKKVSKAAKPSITGKVTKSPNAAKKKR